MSMRRSTNRQSASRRMTPEDRLELLGESPRDPRIQKLQAMSHFLLSFSLSMVSLLLLLREVVEISTWSFVFIPLWVADVLIICLLCYSVYAPLPYVQQLTRLGVPRLGNNPSGTELIPLIALSILKAILAILFTVFQILLLHYLSDKSRSIIVMGIPLFIMQFLGICYAIFLIDYAFPVLLISLTSLLSYVMIILKYQFNYSISTWMVLGPVHLLMSLAIGVSLTFAYDKYRRWAQTKRVEALFVILGVCLIEAFVVSLCLHIESNSVSLLQCFLLLAFGCMAFQVPTVMYMIRYGGSEVTRAKFLIDEDHEDQDALLYREPLLYTRPSEDSPR